MAIQIVYSRRRPSDPTADRLYYRSRSRSSTAVQTVFNTISLIITLKSCKKKSHLLVGVGEFSRATRPDLTTTRPQLAAATMIIEHGLIYYIWTDGLKVAELGNNWNNTRKNGMRIKVRSRGELNGKNNLGFDGNHWPGPSHHSRRYIYTTTSQSSSSSRDTKFARPPQPYLRLQLSLITSIITLIHGLPI